MEIRLTNGQIALIDEEDANLVLSQGSWRVSIYGYAEWVGWKKSIKMHRLIMGFANPYIDHINGNRLDNRKCNLRGCSKSQNQHNRKKNCNSRSKYKGVSLSRYGDWQVRIKVNNKSHWLGRFKNETEAAKAYNAAAIKLHGEFAHINPL